MLYVIAIFCPPIALILAGKPGKALLGLILWILGWLPGVIYAFVVIGGKNADKRTDRVVKAIQAGQR